ncbi:MAG: class I SAM-dependent methyltransferase [Gordonia polyisoprenivorans]|nr:class I SAM-dependent methyltransferase [Gordonia polyisoprenivorans]
MSIGNDGSGTEILGWSEILDRWEDQQGVYVEGRERGYQLMMSLLDVLVPGKIAVLDLAAGPGSLSKRLLQHRSDAQCTAIDIDPVLQTIGRGALGTLDGRLQWVTADLRDESWSEAFGKSSFDAVISSTATHWLSPSTLASMYENLARLIRPGGVFVNFDKYPPLDGRPSLAAASGSIDATQQLAALQNGAESWQDWWETLRSAPQLASAFAERDRIFASPVGRIFPVTTGGKGTSVEFNMQTLRQVGFAEVDVVWQHLQRRIVAAVR